MFEFPTLLLILINLMFLAHNTHALPLPRNLPSKITVSSINTHGHNAGLGHTGAISISLGDRHRRDMDMDSVHDTDALDLDQQPQSGDELEFDLLEVDPTQSPIDDELSRFNNALEQALVSTIVIGLKTLALSSSNSFYYLFRIT